MHMGDGQLSCRSELFEGILRESEGQALVEVYEKLMSVCIPKLHEKPNYEKICLRWLPTVFIKIKQ